MTTLYLVGHRVEGTMSCPADARIGITEKYHNVVDRRDDEVSTDNPGRRLTDPQRWIRSGANHGVGGPVIVDKTTSGPHFGPVTVESTGASLVNGNGRWRSQDLEKVRRRSPPLKMATHCATTDIVRSR